MPKKLETDLGLLSVLAVSIGAMVGSGIFILPALALEKAGPAVIVAYLLAGLLVVPAAVSKSEMATAMPEAGGTYLYIERGMGPLMGTVAGLGTWFSLTFKSGLALVGGIPYLIVFLDTYLHLPFAIPRTEVALALAVVLVAVNLLGAKQSGRVQVAIVAVMLAALGWFIAGSAPATQAVQYGGFFDKGVGGLLEATGLVFVSYAGVTKIASVAEEVENPDRNLPLGILGSLAFTTLLYVAIVTVVVGVIPGAELAGSLTPMADVAARTMPGLGLIAVVVAAMLALISTANAGILSSSRYPFAMSRDDLAPPSLATISDRFGTPSRAILLTGGVMLVLIGFVPILEIAKLASAFKILVFVLINGALVAFRESDDVDYDPSFEAPLYPWLQVVGVVGGFVLLTQMGTLPLVGAVVITLGSLGWYLVYVRGRVDREGVAVDAVRRSVGRTVVERTRTALDGGPDYNVLVAVTEDTSRDRERDLLDLASAAASARDGRVTVVQFDVVPDQTPLAHASSVQSPADVAFEDRTDELAGEFDVPIDYGEIVSHDAGHAIVNFARHEDADLVVMERDVPQLRSRLIRSGLSWVLDHAPCDVVLVERGGFTRIDEIAVATDRSPYDPAKIRLADALAMRADATIRLVYAIAPDATAEQRQTVADYHDELTDLCRARVETATVDSEDPGQDLAAAAGDASLVVVSTDNNLLSGSVTTGQARVVVDRVDGPAVEVHAHRSERPGLLGRLLERAVF